MDGAGPVTDLVADEFVSSALLDRRATNTTYERRSLGRSINLSDAHCRQPLTWAQATIVARLPELFYEAQARPQLELEREFVQAFLSLACEPTDVDFRRHLLSYSSSCAITMLASYCAREGKRVALLEPAFDNTPSILRRENVPLVPISEVSCQNGDLPDELERLRAEVVWIVSPNNPTGWVLEEDGFRELVDLCARTGRLLVHDASFRFYAPQLARWSQYELLERSGVSYVVLEDTGKTWSTAEMKVALTVCSSDVYPQMYRLHDDLLQAVSPFHLRLLTEFMADSDSTGLDSTVRGLPKQNREILRLALEDTPLEFLTAIDTPVSVDWLRIAARFTGEDLWRAAAKGGVHILPGRNFYWSERERGTGFVRIALARDPAWVEEGAVVLREVVDHLATQTGRFDEVTT